MDVAVSPPVQTTNCVICLDNISAEEESIQLRCTHLFHRSCLNNSVAHLEGAIPLYLAQPSYFNSPPFAPFCALCRTPWSLSEQQDDPDELFDRFSDLNLMYEHVQAINNTARIVNSLQELTLNPESSAEAAAVEPLPNEQNEASLEKKEKG